MSEIIVIVIGLLIFGYVVWKFHPRMSEPVAEPVFSETVSLVLEMLRSEHGWEVDKYRATHPTGASVWIANEADDAALSLTGPVWPKSSPRANYVTTTKPERRALFAAARALLDRRQVSELDHATAEWAGRVKHYADNVVSIRGAA